MFAGGAMLALHMTRNTPSAVRMLPITRAACVAIAGTVLAALAGCAAVLDSPGSGGPAVDPPAYRVGDRWVYRAVDGFRAPVRWEETREVTAIAADGITVRITQKGPTVDNTRTEAWSAPGIVRVGALFDDETRRFAAPLKRYEYPLLPGKSWTQFVDNYNEATNKSGQINHYVRVGNWESIATPAGNFQALRMRVLTRLDDDEFWRTATECNYLVAYSPDVRGIVYEEKEAQYRDKGNATDAISVIRSQHATLELVSFTPGKP
jgi:hypothetical protein